MGRDESGEVLSRRKRQLGARHLFIPDTQIKPGVPTHHIDWAAAYALDKRPDVIIVGGDWHDMPSLSSYDKGTRKAEGRRYADDIKAGNDAAKRFDAKISSRRGYSPRKVVVLGNHDEARITRAANADPASNYDVHDLAWFELGWEVVRFLKPIDIDGVLYCHYYCIGPNGRVANSKNGAPSARAQAQRIMQSSVAGHRQGLDTAILHTPTKTIRSVIAGSFYLHEEEYLTPMGENYWRGVIMLNDVRNGEFGLMDVDLRFLEARFG